MRLTPILAFLPLLFACPTKQDDTAPVDDTDADTDSDADSDADADADADTDTDTDADTDAPLVYDLNGMWEGTRFTLTRMVPGEGTLDLYEEITSLAAADPLPVDPGVPDAAVLADHPDYPDMQYALYVPALFQDGDGDGSHDASELYVATSMTWAVYLQGTIPPEYADQGFVSGWNAIVLNFETGDAIWQDPTAIPIAGTRGEITFSGTYEGASDPDDLSLAILPYQMLDGTVTTQQPMRDEPLTLDGSSRWSLTLTTPPPDDHITLDPNFDGFIAMEFPITYMDMNTDGHFAPGTDAIDAMACLDSAVVILAWVEGATDLAPLVMWQMMGMTSGWTLLSAVDGEPPQMLTDAETNRLVFQRSCGS